MVDRFAAAPGELRGGGERAVPAVYWNVVRPYVPDRFTQTRSRRYGQRSSAMQTTHFGVDGLPFSSGAETPITSA